MRRSSHGINHDGCFLSILRRPGCSGFLPWPGTARQTRVAGARARLAFRISVEAPHRSVATSCRNFARMPPTATSPFGDQARQRRADSWRESAEPASGVPLLSRRRRHFEIPAESVCHSHLLRCAALRLKQRRRAHQNAQRLRPRSRDVQSIQAV